MDGNEKTYKKVSGLVEVDKERKERGLLVLYIH